MNPVLRDDPGGKALLLGNEAIVRGALEAGVAVATGYPGTPASEIGDTFAAIARGRLLHFEYSVNEKVAFEVAYGASLSGVRAICSMKHLGLNVAADPLVTSAYVGPVGGLVIVSAADPGCLTSPNEQDHRYLARMSWIPLLDPSDPEEARAMTLAAFELSERWRVPVILRPTTRVSHTQGVVTLGPLPPPASRREFVADPRRFVPVPGIARREREELLARMRGASVEVDSSPFNSLVEGSGRLGIVSTGVSRAYAADAIDDLGLAGEVSVLGIGTPFPLPAGLVASLLERCDTIVVVEEMEPFLEDAIRAEASALGRPVAVRGKHDGLLPWAGEYGPGIVRAALARAAGRPAREASEAGDAGQGAAPSLPGRIPILCAGCPHRSTFTAVRIAIGDRPLYLNDIGCYTLGYGPPLRTADALLAMGSCIPMASGIGRASGRKNVAFIGDSTFFHSGITGLVNAAYNLEDLLVIVLDNRITGMTGHQPNPGMGLTGMGEAGPDLRIEEIARACGAATVEVIDPHDQRGAVIAVREAYESKGLSVIVSRAPCPVHLARSGVHEEAFYEVDDSRCRSCQITRGEAACGLCGDEAHARVRTGKRVLCHPSGTAEGLAPCTAGCPANLCVQGYIAAFQAGDARGAYGIVRASIPLPSVVARVCPRTCEDACVRKGIDGSVGINDVKRAITDAATEEDRKAVREALRGSRPASGRRVAVVGAGPAGLACASDLAIMGHEVSIFESSDRPGGLLSWAIPPFRLPRDVVYADVEDVLALGPMLVTGRALGRDFSVESLVGEGFEAVFLGMGAGSGRRLGIEGEDAAGVIQVLDLLAAVSRRDRPTVGSRVIVLGGGDAAIDAARTAVRLGASDARIVYRRGRAEMPAAAHEIEAAIAEGVIVEDRLAPVRIVSVDGKARGLVVCSTAPGAPDASGRPAPVPVPGSEREIPADTILVAVGQSGMMVDADPATGATDDPRVFAGGDLVMGPSSVVRAIASGRIAARSIDRMLRGQGPAEEPLFRGPEAASDASSYVTRDLERVPRTEDPAVEAGRCLGCASCARCDACISTLGCPAFYRDEKGRLRIDRVLCWGCGVCAALCPDGAIRRVERRPP